MSTTKTIRVRGGKSLQGDITIAPNKNAILPAIAASILTKSTMTYHNVPHSPDVIKMLKALQYIGAEVNNGDDTVTICCKHLQTSSVPGHLIDDMQAGYLFAGPLLARFGRATIPIASGCRLGYRGFEDHARYFEPLNVGFEIGSTPDSEEEVTFVLKEPINDPRIVVVDEALDNKRSIIYQWPYVTPTENVLLLLAKTSRFNTEVSGIAQEPHVAQLIALLRSMGVKIGGKGSTVSLTGADTLKGAVFTTEPDHVDYFGFAVTAAMTKSDLLLRLPTSPLAPGIAHMNSFIKAMGIVFEITDAGVMVYGKKSSFAPASTFQKADKDVYKMNPGPWPQFPVDCLPSFIAFSTMNPDPLTATRSMNWMYTDGLSYVSPMKEMGARIVSHDDQRVVVGGTPGGTPYSASLTITAPGVIEGVRAIISCALSGGDYTIKGVEYILRRNPDFFTILKRLEADITELEETVHE